jgi:ribosome-associated translation inhibitor RaiA
MRIQIETHGLTLSREDRDHIEQRVQDALSRCGEHAMGATVHLSDINGPRGGDDKDCHLVVELDEGRTVVRDRGASVRALVDRALHRAVHAVQRQLKAMQHHTRRGAGYLRSRRDGPRNRRAARALELMPDGAY